MTNTNSEPLAGRAKERLACGEADLCSRLPIALRRLLLRDAAMVIGLCFWPNCLSSLGSAALHDLLEMHAHTNAVARAALDVINHREVRS